MKIFFVLSFSLTFAAAFSQTTNRVLTFEEAVKIALKNSVRLNQEKNNLGLNQAQKLAAYSGIGPGVQASLSASRNDGNYFNTNTGQVVNGVNDNISGSITASMNLFSGFAQINTIRQFSSQLEAQSYLVQRTAQDVINTVSTQYLRIMLDEELLKIAKENFEAQTKQLQQIKEQVELGARSPVDEHNQNTQTRAAELRYLQADIALINDKALLAQTLLIDPLEEFEVERPTWDINVFGAEPLNMSDLINTAKQSRGDYVNAVKIEEAQRYGMYAARGAMAPSLSAFFRYGSAYNKQHDMPDSVESYRTVIVNDPASPSGYSLGREFSETILNPEYPRPFNEQFRTNNVFKTYGLSLTIPLFNGLQNRTTYYRQKVQYRNAQLAKNNLEFQIKNDVLRSVRNYEMFRKSYTVALDQLRSAEIAFQLETERYNLGITNFVDYSNANRLFVQAQTDKAQAEYTLVFQKIILEYAVGTLKIEDSPQQSAR